MNQQISSGSLWKLFSINCYWIQEPYIQCRLTLEQSINRQNSKMPSGSINEEEKRSIYTNLLARRQKFDGAEGSKVLQIIEQQQGRSSELQIRHTLDKDKIEKEKFLLSKDAQQFSQMIVISQFRMDTSNDDPFVKDLFNVVKAIFKSINQILLKVHKFDSKKELKTLQNSIVRVFMQDINVGFITSTGQLKSTAYIYVNNSVLEILNRQKVNLEFSKFELKIILTYFSVNSLRVISPAEKVTHMDLHSSFLRNNKFYNEFLVLQQTSQEELKEGISIFFVYRPIDDQIYAVKRSRLCAKKLSFFEVFQTGSVNELTLDQRKIREAKILSKLTHPNILRLFDWWIEQTNGIYYLYMQLEYCAFPGFRHQTTDLLTYSYYYLNPLPNVEKLQRIKRIMLQIISGIEYIHKRGVVHRDLKPENFFVTISIHGELQVVLADFDQGKDVRETKLSAMTCERIDVKELESVRSQNTIKAGTSGYQTENYEQYRTFDQADEYYAIGVSMLHLVLTFPGEPKNRNHYSKTVMLSEVSDVIMMLDSWSLKYVKNRNKDFSFSGFKQVLTLAKKLMSKQISDIEDIRQHVQNFD